jgi:uncharacterized cupin superfamily protein
VQRINLHDIEPQYDADDPEGYRVGSLRLGPHIGGSLFGATVYELATGQSICPYHYEYGNEEWAIVLAGAPLLRHPGGEDELREGDVVCFPVGPEGAHKLTNGGDMTARVLLLSTKIDPAVCIYPDSDKIGVYPGEESDNVIVRRESNVDYWAGELERV